MKLMFNGKELITGSVSSTSMLTVTLTADGWDENGQQTVEAPGIVADETKQAIQPMPKTTDQQAYYAAGILCIGQDADRLTFRADTIPADDLTVYVAVTAVGQGGGGGTSSLVLDHITIVTEPEKLQYSVGEPFDSTGMQVAAIFTDESELRFVRHDLLTVSPSGPLEAETQTITVSFDWFGVTKGASVDITVIDLDNLTFEWWSPKMTSNNAPVPYAAFGTKGGPGDFWNAFDDNISTYWHDGNVLSVLGFDFGEQEIFMGLRMRSRDRYPNQLPSTFTVEGSDDQNAWETIYSETNLAVPVDLQWREHVFNRPVHFRYCRIVTTKSNYEPYRAIGDVEFYVGKWISKETERS